MRLDYDIALATPDDIPGMLALQDANLPDKGGSLSVRLTEDWFRDTILEKSIVVARCNSKVIGYVMGTALEANAHIAIIQAMLRAFPAPPDCYLMVRFAWPKASAVKASRAPCLKNCDRAFPDARPCFSCGPTIRPHFKHIERWVCENLVLSTMKVCAIWPSPTVGESRLWIGGR